MGVLGDSGNVDSPRSDVEEEEHAETGQAGRSKDFDGEEVRGDDRVFVGRDEVGP